MTAGRSVLSVSASSLFRNASQFSRALLYFVMTSYGSLTFCLLGEATFPFANSAFSSSCWLSKLKCSSCWRANRASFVSLLILHISPLSLWNVISISAASIIDSNCFAHSLTLSKAYPPSKIAGAAYTRDHSFQRE